MSDDVANERSVMGGTRGLLAAALAGLAVLGLAACADADRPRPPSVAATTTTVAGPDGIRDRVVAWETGRLDADPRRLVVSFTGADPADPCWEGYAPEVSAEVLERSPGGQELAVRWREGRRGLAVSATFPTDPSEREVAALQRLLVRLARGLR
jgi:hypothetical protein